MTSGSIHLDSSPGTTGGLARSTGEKTHLSTNPRGIIKVIVFVRYFFDACLGLFFVSITFKCAILIANGILRAIHVVDYISNQFAAFTNKLVHACVPTRNEELGPSYVKICTCLLLSAIVWWAVRSRRHVFHPTHGFRKNVFTRAMFNYDSDAGGKITLTIHFRIKINDLTFELVVRGRVPLKQTINTGNVDQDKDRDERDGEEVVEEVEEAEEELALPVLERSSSAAGSHDLAFSNNGPGNICNQNVGNVVNTTIIYGFGSMQLTGRTPGRLLYV